MPRLPLSSAIETIRIEESGEVWRGEEMGGEGGVRECRAMAKVERKRRTREKWKGERERRTDERKRAGGEK